MDHSIRNRVVLSLAMLAFGLALVWGGCGEKNDGLESICGNGIVEPGEQCDDGNITDGDGCSSICTIEPTPPPTQAPAATPTSPPPSCRPNDGGDPGDPAEAHEFSTHSDNDGDSDVFCP